MPESSRSCWRGSGTFDFGAKDVNEMVVNYPLDFLPS